MIGTALIHLVMVAGNQGGRGRPAFLGDADSTLVRLLDPPPELAEDVHLLLHERGRRLRPVRAVADALGQVFRNGADALGGHGSVTAAAAEVPQTSAG